MIHSIGVDIVSVEKFRQAVERWGQRFLERLFSPEELSACMRKARTYESLAARFAAKEATIKALTPSVVGFKEIEVLNMPDGRPFLRTAGRLTDMLEQRGIRALHLSLSHHEGYAVAFVVADRG